MSAIKFYFNPDKLQADMQRADSERKSEQWLCKNVGNSAIQVAENQALYWSKVGLYTLTVGSKPSFIALKEVLAMDLSCDQYGNLLRNNVIFKLSPGVSIGLLDVKIDYYKENTIVSTPLVGRKGTIKEFIQGGDYNITFTGTLFSEKNNPSSFPIKQLKSFVEAMSGEESIEVANVQLNELDISRVVVKRFDIIPTKFVNTCGFRLVMLSDEDYKLELD